MTYYYPGIEEVISAHNWLIARFGGSLGIRDRAGLESALARPKTGYYEDLIQEAAAAVTVTAAFLRVNGYVLEFDDLTAFQFLIELYERYISFCENWKAGCANNARLADSPAR